MIEAFNILFDIYKKFMQFIFNDMLVYTGVSFGWLMVSIFVFGLLIRNVLMLPKSSQSVNLRSKDHE